MTADGYTEYDSIKIKLRVADDSMREEIQLYMHEIDDLINNRLRAKLGTINIYEVPIDLPLMFDTIPPIPLELKAIANDLVVAKIRLQNSQKPLLWDAHVKVLDNFLEQVYGWTRSEKFQPKRTLTAAPTSASIGATITLSGTNYYPIKTLTVKSDIVEITIPAIIITDTKGVFSATFTIPASTVNGDYSIVVFDNLGGEEVRVEVV